MGFLDRLKRSDDSDAFRDPSTVDPAEALERARKGLEETNTYIDRNGNRRKLPKGAKDPTGDALARAEESVRRSGRREDGD